MMYPYLIAHVVHGESEFAVAARMEDGTISDPGPWWITTGGWRAYPYWSCPLNELFIQSHQTLIPLFLPDAPPDWRDFIVAQRTKKPVKRIPQKIDLEELGL